MQRLEHEVGASLLVRTTRRLSLTEAGEAFFEASRRIVHDAEAAVVAAAESTSEPKGTLRVTAPIDYGATVVAPVSVALQRRFPDLKIELMAGDRVFDLAADGIDLAIRIGQLADSGHQATRIGSFADCLVASPALFGTAGLPQQPDDLDALPFIALSVLPNPVTWPMTHVQGELRQQRFKATLSANTAYAVRMAALAGGGLGILPDFAIEQDLAAGRLVRVLPHRRLFGRRQATQQFRFDRLDAGAAARQQLAAGLGHLDLLDAPVHRMRAARHGTAAFQVGDDHAHGRRRQQRQARQVRTGRAGIGVQHRQHRELRQRDGEPRQRALHALAVRGLRLAQQVADVALLAALAFAHGGNGDAAGALAHDIRVRIYYSNSNIIHHRTGLSP
jgi:DNA-binding transcriptional LysR family regulator